MLTLGKSSYNCLHSWLGGTSPYVCLRTLLLSLYSWRNCTFFFFLQSKIYFLSLLNCLWSSCKIWLGVVIWAYKGSKTWIVSISNVVNAQKNITIAGTDSQGSLFPILVIFTTVKNFHVTNITHKKYSAPENDNDFCKCKELGRSGSSTKNTFSVSWTRKRIFIISICKIGRTWVNIFFVYSILATSISLLY